MRDARNLEDAIGQQKQDGAIGSERRKLYRAPALRPLGQLRQVTLKSGGGFDRSMQHPTRN